VRESYGRGSKKEPDKNLYAVLGIAALLILFVFDAAGLILLILISAAVLLAAAGKKKNSGPEAGGGWAAQARDALGGREQIRRSVQEACAAMKQQLSRLHEEESEGPARGQNSVETHDHIPSTALSTQKRLEQLKTLKGAGLIDEGEYRQKRNEILKEL